MARQRTTRQGGPGGGDPDSPLTDPETPSSQHQSLPTPAPPQQHQQAPPTATQHPPAKQRKMSGSSAGRPATSEGAQPTSSFPAGPADTAAFTGPRPPEPKRKRSASSVGPAAGVAAAPGAKATGPEAALTRNGLEVGVHLCEICKDVLVGAHVMAPCRHHACGDCLFSLILRLIASSPSAASGRVPFACPVEGCGSVVSALGCWTEKDAEVAKKVGSLSTSTYAHRSLEIRRAMHDHKPTLESVIRAIPNFQVDYHPNINRIYGESPAAAARPRSSSTAHASTNAPNATPSRARPQPGPVPSHVYQTPQQQQQQQQAMLLPTPESDPRLVRGGGVYASTQHAQAAAQARRSGSAASMRSNEGGIRGSDKIWAGSLLIPAIGGGEVTVTCEGYTYNPDQPYVPPGLLPQMISLKNFGIVNPPPAIQADSQVIRIAPLDEATARARFGNVTEQQIDSLRRGPGILRQLCSTIAGKGALGITIPKAPNFGGHHHLLFVTEAYSGFNEDASPRLGLLAMVNPAAAVAIGQLTGHVASAGQPRPQGVSPTAIDTLPTFRIPLNQSSPARGQDYSQVQYQQHPYRLSNPSQHLSPPISTDPHNMYQYQQPLNHSRFSSEPLQSALSHPPGPAYAVQPHPPQYRQTTAVSLPPIPPPGPSLEQTMHDMSSGPQQMSAVPQHLPFPSVDPSQGPDGGGSSEYLTYPSSPEPNRPAIDSSSAAYPGNDATSTVDGFGQGEGLPPHEQVSYDLQAMLEAGVQQQQDHGGNGAFDGTGLGAMANVGGEASGNAAGGSAWSGTVKIAAFGDTNEYAVAASAGRVRLRDDVRSRFDPVNLPLELTFGPSTHFHDLVPTAQDQSPIGQVDFAVGSQDQLTDLARSCEAAQTFHQPLLTRMRATDRAVEAVGDVTFVLRLHADRGGDGQPVLAADVYLAATAGMSAE